MALEDLLSQILGQHLDLAPVDHPSSRRVCRLPDWDPRSLERCLEPGIEVKKPGDDLSRAGI
eukprot:CAMPEP_0172626910 /NCGR_PEP_ID=MMETSP1068-20121228/153245_1 /TAXON_ID=35684 /ORGANISM="Pseudopedinella elastica, Strain CCMP716" /LENGTH=61 /DNA_ID=CAMNT_0013436651 /DNA_START=346 /DNA_END=528 /DNA_ORIENTATION=-